MKALVGAFNQEKALVGAFSVIVKTGCETDGSFYSTTANIMGCGDSDGETFVITPISWKYFSQKMKIFTLAAEHVVYEVNPATSNNSQNILGGLIAQ